jgi:hypothetical protein
MKPPRTAFTPRELGVVDAHRTPYQVQQLLYRLPYNAESGAETLRSLRGVLRHRKAHCLEAALSAAAILEQHGYPPLLLDLESEDGLDHVVFLYRSKGLWGTVARSRDPGLHGRKPVFRTLRELVDSYADPFVDLTGRLIGYAACSLEDLGRYDWRLSKRNVWKVQRHLVKIPHRTFRTTDERYRFWHTRYIVYRNRFPDRKPIYYTDRRTWVPGYPRGRV